MFRSLKPHGHLRNYKNERRFYSNVVIRIFDQITLRKKNNVLCSCKADFLIDVDQKRLCSKISYSEYLV